MAINQILVAATTGDAIGRSTLAIRELLRESGPSEIIAKFWGPDLDDEVIPMDTLDPEGGNPEDVLIFHASIGRPDVFDFVMTRKEKVVLIYHNISPAEGFDPYDEELAGLLRLGREELAELKDRVILALADSSYNAEELESLGYTNVRVSPLVLDFDRLMSVEPHEQTLNHLNTNVEGNVYLYVGQMLPHKRPDLLLKSFYILSTYLDPSATLVMVGPARIDRYRQALSDFGYELNLHRLWITGPISDQELVAFYKRANVFVTMSDHEGFCVPLLEAMAFDVPVVAKASAAIPETLGKAGVLVPEDASPELIAEAMFEAATNQQLRQTIHDNAQQRLHDFSHGKTTGALVDNLATVS